MSKATIMAKRSKQPVKSATKARAKRAKQATSRQQRGGTEKRTRQEGIGDFEGKLEKLFSDDERIGALLSLEKSNRGVDQNQLVFAGLSDVSRQTFCSMKAVLGAREKER